MISKTSSDSAASFDIKKIKPRIRSLIILLTRPLMQTTLQPLLPTPSPRRCGATIPLHQVIRMNSVDPNS